MMRLVKVDYQITMQEKGFAFYDTVTEKFITVYDSQYWETADEMNADFQAEIDACSFDDALEWRRLQERVLSIAKSHGY